MRLTKAMIVEKWKIHKYPDSGMYFIGPLHGRIAVATYNSRKEALIALEIQRWMVKTLKLNRPCGGEREA